MSKLNLMCMDFDNVTRLRTWFREGTADATIHGNPNNEVNPTITAHKQTPATLLSSLHAHESLKV